MTINERPHCPSCGSANITVDGCASYNPDTREWELENTYDGTGHCGNCGNDEFHPEWKEIEND